MEKPFLIYTSTVFEGADLIDCIRQSYMDLNKDSDGEMVEDLIKDSIEKLSGDCPYKVANEIIALLSKCFSVLSTDPMPFLNTLFENSKKNVYLMYSFISTLSYLIGSKQELNFEPYLSFINESLVEIKSQINYQDSLTLSGLEIPLQFRANLIVELLLCSNITEQLVDDFSYVLSSNFFNNCPKLKALIEKMADDGFFRQVLLCVLSKDDDDDDTDEETPTENNEGNPVIPTFEDPLFNEFLNDPYVDKNETIKKELFKKMLTEKSNLIGYFQIIFENLDKLKIKPITLLKYFNEELEMSPEDFVKTLDNVYILHPTEKVFVPQPKYKPLNLPDSEFNNKIITKLFDIVHQDPGHFQAFYCLECIANSFPFIFSSNPQKVFDAVLPAFDNYKIIYDERTSDNDVQELAKIRKGKSAIAAISFLLFTLNSTKVCDAFVQWFFKNINNLSLSQLLCIFIVFNKLFSTKCRDHLATLFIKNNFFEAFSSILLKKVPKNLFGLNFNHFMYFLLLINKNLGEKLSPLSVLAIDINKNEDNLFYNGSGCHFTHSLDQIQPPPLKSFIYVDPDKKVKIKREFINFINSNQDFKTTWTIDDRYEKDLPNRADELLLNMYKQLIPQHQEASNEYKLPINPDKMTNDQIRKFVNKEDWIVKYVMQNKRFPLLSEHKKILEEIMKDVCQVDTSSTDEDDDRKFVKKYFESRYRESQTFLLYLISRIKATTYIEPLDTLSLYIREISYNQDDYETVMNTIWQNLVFIDQNNSYTQGSTFRMIQFNLLFLANFARQQIKSKSVRKSRFTEIFFKMIGNNIINFILKPQCRFDENIMNLAYEIFRIFDECPIRLLHIIGFMFLFKDVKYRKNASRLCLGLQAEQIKSINIIEDVFREELNSPKPQLTIISNILKSCSNIGLAHKGSLLTLLEELLNKCQRIKNGENVEEEDEEEDDDDDDDIKMKDFIIQMLDYLSPDRDENRSFTLSDSTIASNRNQKQNTLYRFCPIPDYIVNTAPQFWKVFEEYRPLINEILLKEFKGNKMVEIPGLLGLFIKHLFVENFSSRLVSNYPECFSFEFRSTFFRQMQHEEIEFCDETEFEIDLNNLYESSYEALHQKSPEKWKQKFLIKYLGSEGLDQSGITKDWFTKITLEMFNPNNDLFEMSEKNQNYSPSRSSFAQSEEGLKRLKFAGMIIARALMQGFLVPIQLTKPFLKQILHHEETIKPEDLEDVSEVLYNQLQKIEKYDYDQIDLDFRFEVDFEGQITELIENGSEIRVNNKNKKEFIRLSSLHHMIGAIKKQVNAFCEGFDSIIPHEKIRMFTPSELCLLICGVPKIDVDDLRRNVVIEEPYDIDSPVIKLFFDTIKKWDDENLAKLLLFITGTLRMPSNGFVYFKLINKPITIRGGGERERLPVSHTCINTLDLPEYQTEEEMNSKLLIAITVKDFQIK